MRASPAADRPAATARAKTRIRGDGDLLIVEGENGTVRNSDGGLLSRKNPVEKL
jgi:hypothetical protein